MLLCAVPEPVESVVDGSESRTPPDMEQLVAGWSAIDKSVVLDAFVAEVLPYDVRSAAADVDTFCEPDGLL